MKNKIWNHLQSHLNHITNKMFLLQRDHEPAWCNVWDGQLWLNSASHRLYIVAVFHGLYQTSIHKSQVSPHQSRSMFLEKVLVKYLSSEPPFRHIHTSVPSQIISYLCSHTTTNDQNWCSQKWSNSSAINCVMIYVFMEPPNARSISWNRTHTRLLQLCMSTESQTLHFTDLSALPAELDKT